MSERIDTPFTNEHFAAWCRKMVGQPYWYGTCGYKATASLLKSKTAQYPSHYGSGRTARYQRDIADKAVVADCIGGCKGYAWTGGGQAILDAIGTDNAVTNRYGSNGCPDKSASGMFEYAKQKGCAWGAIASLPEVPGLALFKTGHAGYYVGGGYAVEWRGFSYGCVLTKVADRGWLNWYALPFIDYGESAWAPQTGSPTEPSAGADPALGSRLLKRDSQGADVRALQEALLRLGYALPKYGADGKYGAETEAAVKAFQKKAGGLTVDGKYGEKTHAALMAALDDRDGDAPEAPEQPPEAPASPSDSAPTKVTIVSSGGRVNIRKGNGTNFARISLVDAGSVYPYVATAVNGWHAVSIGAQIGWVSGEFSQVS